MISEVLLGLSGIDGDLVVFHNEKLSLNPKINSIEESERQMINSILKLGTIYRKINTFIENENSNNFLFKTSIQRSMEEMIEEYEISLMEIEQKLLENHFTPFVYLKHSLFKFEILFPFIEDVLESIQTKIQKEQVLNYLYELNSGNPIIKEFIKKMISFCNFSYLKILKYYLIFGSEEEFNFKIHPKISEDLNRKIYFIGETMKKMKSKNLISKFDSYHFKEEGINDIDIKIEEMKKLITSELWIESSFLISNLKIISNHFFILNEENQEEEEDVEFNNIKIDFPLNILITNQNLKRSNGF
eukprot:gene393-6807_t